jgi:hypothetical protein
MARFLAWLKPRWALVVLALLPVLPLWRAVFLGETIGAFDEIRTMAPWNGPATGKPWDVLMADSVLQFYVWRDLVFEAWRGFELPLWNPYQLAGTPLLANSQSGALYPPHVLAGLLHLPTGLALTLLAWAHLAWAGIGLFLLCRRIGASEVGAFVAGASFSLSQFMLAWTALPSVIETCSWIPWLLLGVETAFSRALSPRTVAATGLAAGMLLLAGHLQFAAYGLMAAAFLALWRIVGAKPYRWTGAAGVMAAFALGALLAAPQLDQVLRFGREGHRQAPATEVGYQAYVAGAIPAVTLVGVPNPAFLGLPTRTSPEVEGASTYWPALTHRGMNFAETALGLGPLVVLLLGLAAFEVRRMKPGVPYAVLMLLSLLIALGTPLNKPMYFLLPGWSATGSPGRIAVLFVLSACLLAGLALPDRERIPHRAAVLGTAVFVFLALLPFWALRTLADNLTPWLPQVSVEVVSLLVGGATGATTGAYFASVLLCAVVAVLLVRRERIAFRLLAVASAIVPLALYATQVIRTSPTPLPRIEGPAPGERIAAVNDRWDLLTAVPAVLPPNTASLSRIHDLSGYDSLMHRGTVALLGEIDGQDAAPPANGNMMFVKTSANPLLLAEAGVSEVWTNKPMDKLGVLPAESNGLYRYRLRGPGRAYVEDPVGEKRPAKIEREGFGRMTLRATGPGRLIVKDRAMKGWSADVGGTTRSIPEGRWMEIVDLPPGEQVVEFHYSPPGLKLWLALSGLAWIATLGISLRRPKPSSTDQDSEEGFQPHSTYSQATEPSS